jgi:LCP family protein required for cell wall assembly
MRRVVLWVVGGCLAVIAALLAVAYWQASSIVAQLHAGPKEAIVKAVAPELHRTPRKVLVRLPKEPSAQTILLIGSDRRWTGGDGARSDTIMLARVEPSRHRIALLSIPRDLYVSIPGHGHDRINMAFHDGGERLLTRVVRDTFGVRIDHFVEIDFHGFKDVISDLGGAYLPIDQRYYNRNVGTAGTNYSNIDLQPGYQKVSAQQALAFARYRHTDNDFVRAARQQLLLRVIAHDVLAGSWDPFRIRRLALAVAKATTSDISSLSEVFSLARAIHDTAAAGVVHLTVPAQSLTLYGADYLAASRGELVGVIRRWLGTPSRRRPHRSGGLGAEVSARPGLIPDNGRGAALLNGVAGGMRRCAPTALPAGFWWPSGAARSYTLAGHPALALYATAGSGDSVLWMYTTWGNPPILDHPTGAPSCGSRAYRLYTEHGKLRMIAWHKGGTEIWITNTLENTLTNAQMLGLARTCR